MTFRRLGRLLWRLAALLYVASLNGQGGDLTNQVQVYTNIVVTTNWFSTGNTARRDGTNYVEQYASEITAIEYQEVVTPKIIYVTNQTPMRVNRILFAKTNAMIRMNPVFTNEPIFQIPSKL